MVKGKALAFSLLVGEYAALFGKDLTVDQYRYLMKAYMIGIKAGIERGGVVRLTWLGSYQPCGLRLSLNRSPKREGIVAGYNNSAYICGVNEQTSNSLFKPKYYVSPSKSPTGESTGFKPRELGSKPTGETNP